MAESTPTEDLETLRRRASALETKAEVAALYFDRTTWIRLVLLFFPVPFVVVLFRLHLDPWGYYTAGALIITFGMVLVAMDKAAMRKRDAALKAAEHARKAYEDARTARGDVNSARF
jgi:hypothetical protein